MKNVYKNGTDYVATVTCHIVTDDEIFKFVKESVVKFIFFDKEYADISSDKTINELHRFKSKYRGNTYIRIPLKIVKGEDDKYASGVEIDNTADENDATAFVVVSKHDLRDMSKEMKKANKDERVAFGEKLCAEYVDKLNHMLNNDMVNIVIRDNKTYTIVATKVLNGGSITDIDAEINKIIEDIQLKAKII